MSDTTLQKAPPALSIVVPVRDRWDDTFQLLLTLARMPLRLPLEIVVVDDGSKDESKIALPRLEGPILHQNEEPLGLVRAANQGAALARAPFLLFLTQGAIPEEGPILALLAALEEDPDLSAAGPCLRNRDLLGPAPDADAATAFGARTGQFGKAGLPPLPALPLQGLLLRTRTFREVGASTPPSATGFPRSTCAGDCRTAGAGSPGSRAPFSTSPHPPASSRASATTPSSPSDGTSASVGRGFPKRRA